MPPDQGASSLPNGITPMSEETAAQAILGILGANPPPNATNHAEEVKEAPEVPPEKAETADVPAEEPQAEDETTYSSLEELAEASGLGMDKLLNLSAKTKIDGQESSVPLAQLLKSYQLEGHLTKEQMKLADTRKAFEAEAESSRKELSSRLSQADAVLKQVEDHLMKDYAAIDWNTLRATDPAEFAARQVEMSQRYQQVQQWKKDSLDAAQKLQQEQADKFQKQYQEILQKETEMLSAKLPEWNNQEKAKSEKAQLTDYLKSIGYNDAEIRQMTDHRAIIALRDAMLYRNMAKQANTQAKKVNPVPKFQKPGPKRGEVEQKADKESELMSRLRKSGKPEDAVDILLNRGFFKGM